MTIRFAAALAAVLLAGAFVAGTPERASSAPACARLTLTGHPSYPPISWSARGTLEGAGIAVVRALAKNAGVPLSVVDEGSWGAAQAAVKSGKADVIVGLYRTDARLPFFDYVEPAMAPDPSAVIVRADDRFAYTNWQSLIGKRGVASEGESYGAAFDAFAKSKLEIVRVPGFDAVYDAVVDRKGEYGLVGYYAAEMETARGKIRIAEPAFVTEGLYVAFAKGSPCSAALSARFSSGLKAAIAGGSVKRAIAAALAAYEASHSASAP